MSLSQSEEWSHLIQNQQDKSRDNEVIRRHYDFLIDRMSPEFGLIDRLYSNRTLSEIQKDEIEAASIYQKKNEILLKHIVKKNNCKELFEALKECGQSHLVKYMESDGVYRPELGGNWPLVEKERTILLDNYGTLVDLLDSRDIVGLLYQTGVLNKRQKNLVSSKATPEEKNKVLLNILRKGSLDFYWQMIKCLHASNQSHIARLFESGGVVVRIDANLQPESSNLSEVEIFLATEITNLLRHTPHSEVNRIWELVQLNLVGAAASHSVSLYFLCSNKSEVYRLQQMASDGQLKKLVEDFFNRLIKFPERVKATLKWSRHLFSKSRKYIEAIQAKNCIDEPMKTTIQCLPLELLDIILQRTNLCYNVRSGTADGDGNSDFIVFLGTVNALWLERILRKRFKKRIWRSIKKFYRGKFEVYLSFRDSGVYLEEAIQVEDVKLKRQELQEADFLSDLQIARLSRKGAKLRRNRRRSEMLTILAVEFHPVRRGHQKTDICDKFIRYLRQTQTAEVLERKGDVVKVEIRQPKYSKTDVWSKDFSSRLNNLKDRTQLKSDDIEKIIQQLEVSDIEILNSFVDRGVSVWIWCRSVDALGKLYALYRSQILIDHLYRLANEENDPNRSTENIHLDAYIQLKKHVVTNYFSNLVIEAEGELEMETSFEYSIGVTKLRNKIFILGVTDSNPTSRFGVYVFDDQHPFKLQREMTFEEIKNATDISSFEKKFCLYIVDTEAKCIWKICPPDEDKIKDGKFMCTALKCPDLSRFIYCTMTITNGGQILIVDGNNSILLFFESESDLNHPIRIDLPDEIYRPEQVAENSVGNFIFLHRTRERYYPGDVNYWVVSKVSRNGKTIIRHHSGTGDLWLKPDGEAFLLVDSHDRIFLSDTKNSRLILLDSSLQHACFFVYRFYHESGLLLPPKMFYDGEKNQLIVAEKRKVFVFSFSGF